MAAAPRALISENAFEAAACRCGKQFIHLGLGCCPVQLEHTVCEAGVEHGRPNGVAVQRALELRIDEGDRLWRYPSSSAAEKAWPSLPGANADGSLPSTSNVVRQRPWTLSNSTRCAAVTATVDCPSRDSSFLILFLRLYCKPGAANIVRLTAYPLPFENTSAHQLFGAVLPCSDDLAILLCEFADVGVG